MARKPIANGRASGTGTFVAFPHAVLRSPAFCGASSKSVKLLMGIASQFSGYNNGALCASWATMRPLGWRSRSQITEGMRELIDRGLIERTRFGGRHRAALFALTWLPIDACSKYHLDVAATTAPSGSWRKFESAD
jgi:hypothetical protein